MDLTNLLPANRVVIKLKSCSQKEILEQLAQPLVDEGIVTDKELFVVSSSMQIAAFTG